MRRVKGAATTGPTRSARLPSGLDRWFEERLYRHPERSASELLVALIHGGLRLREGYMAVNRRSLERYLREGRLDAFQTYRDALLDTFGEDYVGHLEEWLRADGVTPPART